MTQPNHSERGHAEFSPSSLKYVATCAGYEGRDGTSAAAEMGTRIHEALEVHDPSALHNEEELAIYEQIVQMETNFMSNFGAIAEEHNEIQVTVELNGTETWGTCDRFLILECATRAVMADYKTGISIIDPPDKNWQAKAYVVGAFQRFENINEITFVFYVPQHNACLHYTFTRDDLPRLIAELSSVIKYGEHVRPKWGYGTPSLEELTPSANCRFCKHEDYCPALGGLVLDVAKRLQPSLPDVDIEKCDEPEVIEQLYTIAKIVGNWAERTKKRMVDMAKDGVEFPTMRLKSMGQTRKITDNIELIDIAANFGLTPADLLSECSVPFGKLASMISKKDREEGEKFIDACAEAGILQLSEVRYTIAPR